MSNWIRPFSTLVAVSLFAACDGSSVDSGMNKWPDQDPALQVPWSELKGHIAIYYQTDLRRQTLIINSERRTVKHMGDFGSYISGFDLSPDGRTLALGYFLGSGYGDSLAYAW